MMYHRVSIDGRSEQLAREKGAPQTKVCLQRLCSVSVGILFAYLNVIEVAACDSRGGDVIGQREIEGPDVVRARNVRDGILRVAEQDRLVVEECVARFVWEVSI